MKEEHLAQLEIMTNWYGTFAVAEALSKIGRAKCDGDYVNNPGAIIHRDTQVLEDAVLVMRHSHPLRGA